MSGTHTSGWGIVGHEHAVDLLRRALVAQRVRHAYLFTGPEHIGKALLARRFAQTLLCTGGPDPRIAPQNPCNVCLSCRKVMHNNHPDVHRSEEHTSELQSPCNLVCRLLLEKKKH